MKNEQIAIIGGSLNGNSGAEAMLNTAIKRLEQKIPNAVFGIYTPYYKDDSILWDNTRFKKIYLIDASPIKLVSLIFPLSVLAGLLKFFGFNAAKNIFPESIRFLWESDVCIDIAGVSFIDSRLKFLPYNVLSIYPFFLMQVPVIKYAQATGPYKKLMNRLFARHCLKKCEHVFVRGKKSFQHIDGLQIPATKYSLSTDVSFCSHMGDSLTVNNLSLNDFLSEISKKKAEGRILIGICPSSVIFESAEKMGQNYIDFLIDLARSLSRKKYHIVFFANATKEHKPHIFRNNDLPLIYDIVNKISFSDISAYKANVNADGVKSIINCLDICVVSRFHAMIFSLIMKKPVFVIGWSHKYMEIMEQFELSEYVVDFREANIKKILQAIDSIFEHVQRIDYSIDSHIEEVKSIALQQIDFTQNFLSKQNKKR
jgi:colanic acid/amylovoran biosynthesis protein